MDTVDDLQGAEDLVCQLGQTLRAVMDFRTERPWTGLGDAYNWTKPGEPDLVGSIRAALAEVDGYCRSTCGWLRDGECGDDEDTCGCPCEHSRVG